MTTDVTKTTDVRKTVFTTSNGGQNTIRYFDRDATTWYLIGDICEALSMSRSSSSSVSSYIPDEHVDHVFIEGMPHALLVATGEGLDKYLGRARSRWAKDMRRFLRNDEARNTEATDLLSGITPAPAVTADSGASMPTVTPRLSPAMSEQQADIHATANDITIRVDRGQVYVYFPGNTTVGFEIDPLETLMLANHLSDAAQVAFNTLARRTK